LRPGHQALRRPDGWPLRPEGKGVDFSSASSLSNALGAFFCNFPNRDLCHSRGSAARAAHGQPPYQMLWVRGFRAHTISGRGFNLFKPLRRHFRAVLPSPSRAAIPANETPRYLLRPEPHEFSRLDVKAAPTPGANEARKAPKTPYHEFCLYERKTPRNRNRPFQGKIAPEDAASYEAITGRPSVSQLSKPRLSRSKPSAHGLG
jgi:hypothetical protein